MKWVLAEFFFALNYSTNSFQCMSWLRSPCLSNKMQHIFEICTQWTTKNGFKSKNMKN